jgi:hypothetical protein
MKPSDLVDELLGENTRYDFSTAAKHITKTAKRVAAQPGPLSKKDSKDLRTVAGHLHHGRANKARAKFHGMDTAARDQVSVGMMGHKRGKGSVERSLGIQFAR